MNLLGIEQEPLQMAFQRVFTSCINNKCHDCTDFKDLFPKEASFSDFIFRI